MFPSGVPLTGRKKGCAFEAAEPSSPKVTCIGQVRVKAKKKVKSKAKATMARSRSQRGKECCSGRNQSWVHQLPLSICEALRGIGTEFNCLLPCGGRSLCGGGSGGGGSYSHSSSRAKGREERRIGRPASSSSCGAVLAKWVVAVQESEEEVKGGEKVEVGFLLRESDEKKITEVEFEERGGIGREKREILVVGEKGDGGGEEAARVSVCIPPKNALLLMRCRSDPVRMAALANRFWGSPGNRPQCEEGTVKEEDREVDGEAQDQGRAQIIKNSEVPLIKEEGDAIEVSAAKGELVEQGNVCDKATEVAYMLVEEKLQLLEEEIGNAGEELSTGSPPMLLIDPLNFVNHGETPGIEEQEKGVASIRPDYLPEKEEEEEEEKDEAKITLSVVREERKSGNGCPSKPKERGRRRSKEKDNRRHSFSSEVDSRRHSFSADREARRASFSIDRGSRWSLSLEKAVLEPKGVSSLSLSATEVCPAAEEEKEVTPEGGGGDGGGGGGGGKGEAQARGYGESEKVVTPAAKHEPEKEEEKQGVAGGRTELPDCLLMMMYEPKLSMEVSKETWVCGNDFLRWRPHHPRNPNPSKPGVSGHTSGHNVAAAPPAEPLSTVTSAPEVKLPVAAAVPPTEAPRVAAVQHKLSARPSAVAPYEPLVLTRCKSEPMRSSAKLTPDACFWKDRHRPVGAAGIGF